MTGEAPLRPEARYPGVLPGLLKVAGPWPRGRKRAKAKPFIGPDSMGMKHELPLWLDPRGEIWFVTVCCHSRGVNQLAFPKPGKQILASVQHRNSSGAWWAWVITVMPDHVHLLMSCGSNQLWSEITHWKKWLARDQGIHWQTGFFEHRLRRNESFNEKGNYVLMNPVRAGLVEHWWQWPYTYRPEECSFMGFEELR